MVDQADNPLNNPIGNSEDNPEDNLEDNPEDNPEDQVDNPWDVDSLEGFTFLKCPECIFDTKEENNFLEHAFKNHPMSSVFFGRRMKKEADTEEITDVKRLTQS